MWTISGIAEFTTYWTIWLGLIGQTGFVCLLATRPWRHFRVTRAYFMKSVAMWAIFARSSLMLAALGGVRSFDNVPNWVNVSGIVLNGFVLWAIWYQFFAMVIEVVYGSQEGSRDDMMRSGPMRPRRVKESA